MRRLGVWVATTGPAGYAPIAPGTVGSAVGVVLYLVTGHWSFQYQALLMIAVAVIGVWAASVAEVHFSRSDPSQVVIDEVAGQLLTYLGLGLNWTGVLAGFLLFRALDIVKPWPARRLEHLHGGTGIMADDLMVAVYANLILRGVAYVLPGWL
jgi:phosphatidylglycerophosphatase A